MINVLLILIFGLLHYSTSASNNSDDLKTFQSGISDVVSGAHARQNKSLPSSCSLYHGEWVILVSNNGDVIIYNPRSYEERIGYYAPELTYKIIGIVNREFYSVDSQEGVIRSTRIEQIFEPPIDKNGKPDIKWKYVGSFRAEQRALAYHIAVKGNIMYFGTMDGFFYSYDTTSKMVDYRFSLPKDDYYTSLIMFDDVLYIYRNASFYTYDGKVLKVLETPGLLINDPNIRIEMFKFLSTICTVGWDGIEAKIAKYPVYCWDPKKKDSKWEIFNYSYEARVIPAAVTTTYGSFVFSGRSSRNNSGPWQYTISVEMLDYNTLKWSYVPSTTSMKPVYYSAVTFNCD